MLTSIHPTYKREREYAHARWIIFLHVGKLDVLSLPDGNDGESLEMFCL